MDVNAQLEQLANDSPYDVESLKELFEEKLAEVEENSTDEVPEESKRRHALMLTKSDYTRELSAGSSADELDIISLGHGGIRSWSDGDVLIAYGVVQPPDEPAHVGGIIFDEGDGHNFNELKGKFQPLQRLSGGFNWNASTDLADTYVVNATATTEVTVQDTDMSLEERRQWVNNNHVTERAEISNIMDHLSAGSDQAGFAGTIGSDVKRIQGSVVDYFVSNDGETGGYVIQDDSIVDPRDYDEDRVVGDKREYGLTAWIDPELMNYGENSICDFYGSVTMMDNGQVVMNVYSVVPLPGMANEIDIKAESGGTPDDDNDIAEETTI